MPSILVPDSKLVLPNLTVISASAGSGKTHTLTMRYLQLLLSPRIPFTDLSNILAMTFTNNAANEMKQRILKYLKEMCVGNESVLAEMEQLVSLDRPALIARAEQRLEEILDRYSEFQVRTIDSFLIAVFQSTALELGLPIDAEVTFQSGELLAKAFDEFAKDAAVREQNRTLLDSVVELIAKGRTGGYLWNPYQNLLREVNNLYGVLRAMTKPLDTADHHAEMMGVSEELQKRGTSIQTIIEQSGLPVKARFLDDLRSLIDGGAETVLGREVKTELFNKLKKDQESTYRKFGGEIEQETQELYGALSRYAYLRSLVKYDPYVRFLGMLEQHIQRLLQQEKAIALDDIGRALKESLNRSLVPEIYFKLGEQIHHYLIDEFQDTSPIQWIVMKPLLEETLSATGSLFVVGDTKQSIYGFRGADWRIMKRVEAGSEFESAAPHKTSLDTNYRSHEAIVAFNDDTFTVKLPQTEFAEAARLSGLSSFVQLVRSGYEKKGYVRVEHIESDGYGDVKDRILATMDSLRQRGVRYADVAILSPANDDIVRISGWLSERGIPFISHSNLDVRSRKGIRELIALVKFLDSPIDDLSFATFLLGEIMQATTAARQMNVTAADVRQFIFKRRLGDRSQRPLYVRFREEFAELWSTLFEKLFERVGYFPLYDLIASVYATFDLFHLLPNEEAALATFLEAVQAFEANGMNNVKEFAEFAESRNDEDAWTMPIPSAMNAVRLMTIHKAKGLDFEVVLVYLPDKKVGAGNFIIDDQGETVRLHHVVEKLRNKNPELQNLHRHALAFEQADALNRLYVALTRSRSELYVWVHSAKELEGVAAILEPCVHGSMPVHPASAERPSHEADLTHVRMEKEFQPSVAARPRLRETQRGDVVHAALARIQFLSESQRSQVAHAVEAAAAESGGAFEAAEMTSLVVAFLQESGIEPWFLQEPGRKVLTEQEYVNKTGELYRCDRVVIDERAVTVIDFKTGGDEMEAEYRTQVGNYISMLKEVYPTRMVGGLIAYVDLKRLVSV